MLRSNRQLFAFPIYGVLASVVGAIVARRCPGLYLIDDGERVAGGLLAAVGIYLASFIATYFAVGLASTADAIFHGRDATFADGMAAAREQVGAIAGWAALSALVGTLFAVLRQGGTHRRGDHRLGSARRLGPDHLPRRPGDRDRGPRPVATLKRSAKLFKERWAGQVTGNVAIGGIVAIAGSCPPSC